MTSGSNIFADGNEWCMVDGMVRTNTESWQLPHAGYMTPLQSSNLLCIHSWRVSHCHSQIVRRAHILPRVSTLPRPDVPPGWWYDKQKDRPSLGPRKASDNAGKRRWHEGRRTSETASYTAKLKPLKIDIFDVSIHGMAVYRTIALTQNS